MSPPAPPPWPWTDHEPLRFDRFMERALHDPVRGYYARRIQAVGRGGDFTTTPMLSTALARAIAAWVVESGLRNLIEIGPGEGRLAADVMKAIPWWKRRRITLHLVERSTPLREKQQALLGNRARWHESIRDALKACPDGAAIVSNELIDAFAARRFQKAAHGWNELFLLPGNPPSESWQPAGTLPESSLFRLPHPTGQIIEVHESAMNWLREWLPGWSRGRMLIIDYGDEDRALYHRRPHGTLRGYLLQQRVEGRAVYQNAGRQDLTVDVNFTDLRHTAALASAREIRLKTQREFLLPYVDPANPVDAALVDPAGAGSAFKVMEIFAADR